MRDERLERAFAQRDPWAYETAYRLMGARLAATAMRVLRAPEASADCVHDVFLRLWRRGSAYTTERGSLEAYLVTCVRNEALARVRNDARRAELRALVPTVAAYEYDEDPLERDRIAEAIAALSVEQAETVRLAYFRGLTLAEIAADLGAPLGTVKSRISAALRALRRRLIEESHHAL